MIKLKTIVQNISAIFTVSDEIDFSDPGSSVQAIEGKDIIIENGKITEMPGSSPGHFDSGNFRVIDAGGDMIIPGFIDSHTHIMYCGKRTEEFYMRMAGRSYSEILASGGGILSTVRATRACTPDELYENTLRRVLNALSLGTTTIEIKTGYGLDLENEKKMMKTIMSLRESNPLRTVATALPLHAVPEGTTEKEYLDYVLSKVLPELLDSSDFVDIFCDRGAFSPDSASKLALFLERNGKKFRMHSGEIENIGCAKLASDHNISSVDHLIHTDRKDRIAMKKGGSVATILPVTAFTLGESYPDAQNFIAEKVPLAIATDSSPLTMCQNMPFAMHLGVKYCNLSPLEAFVASTANPAKSLALDGHTGRIRPGLSADMVFMAADSVEDIPYMWNTGIINKVMYQGNMRYENTGKS